MLNSKKFSILLLLLFITNNNSFAQNRTALPDHAFSIDYSSHTIPSCKSASSDIDGDGWGWENFNTCFVGGEYEYVNHPECESTSSDPDGDGWGWENNSSCKVIGSNSEAEPVSTNFNVTPQFDEPELDTILQTNFIETHGVSSSEVEIEFEFTSPGPAFINFGFTEQNLQFRGPVETNSFVYHKQLLGKLEAGRKYYFEINSDGAKSKINSFTVSSLEAPIISAAQPITTPLNGSSLNLPSQERITLPRDAQPSTPSLPDIGQFIDMPGTNGRIEFTRVNSPKKDNAYYHSYARRSAVDPFNKYILLNDYLLNLSDFSEFKRVPTGFEYVAAQTREDEFFGFQGSTLVRWNAVTDKIIEIWKGPVSSKYTIGRYEGQQSWDDKYIVVMWENSGHQIAVINLDNGSLMGQISGSSVGGNVNWADISPLGTYVLVGTSTGVFRYDKNLKNKQKLNAKQTGNAHGDLMFDKAGNEVFAQEGHYYDGDISYTILSTNKMHIMELVDAKTQSGVEYPNAASHISGQASGLPGKVFVSLQDTSGMSSMFTADLVPGQTKLQHYGHSYTTGHRYSAEAKASISNDGRYVVWASDWMNGSGEIYEFLLRVK